MPGYGVPDALDGALAWSWAEERLLRNHNYWLATASADGRPHVLPVWGVWRPDPAAFVFSCGPASRKAGNLAATGRAGVAVDDTVECVSVEGVARVIEAGEPGREEWIAAYMAKYGPLEPELSAEFVRGHLMVEVTPTRAFAIIERADEFATRATRWVFD